VIHSKVLTDKNTLQYYLLFTICIISKLYKSIFMHKNVIFKTDLILNHSLTSYIRIGTLKI
jgi:hypothetical protein